MREKRESGPKRNYFKISHGIIEDYGFNKLGVATRYLYIYLCKLENKYGGRDGWFKRSDRKIEEATKISRITIMKSRRELEEMGYIETDKKDKTCCRYRIIR